MKTAVFRKVHFNCAHRLHNPKWSDDKNKQIFGICNNAHYHGHNYQLVVKLTGMIDEETGYVFDMKILNDLLNEHVVERFDHRNLNLDVAEFKDLNPTAENIAKVIYELIRGHVPADLEIQITLYETERNFVMFPA